MPVGLLMHVILNSQDKMSHSKASYGQSTSINIIRRKDTYCILAFSDDNTYKLDYLEVRKNCQCAKCKPRQVNEQIKIEFEEEISRMMLVKPKVEQVGNYAIRFEWANRVLK